MTEYLAKYLRKARSHIEAGHIQNALFYSRLAVLSARWEKAAIQDEAYELLIRAHSLVKDPRLEQAIWKS